MKTPYLSDIQARSKLTSEVFASFFGEQNQSIVRLLPYETKKNLSQLLSESVRSQFNYYKSLSTELLEIWKEQGFVILNNLVSPEIAVEIERYFWNKNGQIIAESTYKDGVCISGDCPY